MKSPENQSRSRWVSLSDADRSRPLVVPLADRSPVPCELIGTGIAFLRERSVLDFFQAQVQSQPESVAIKEGTRLMTYAELDLCANRVANELCRRGVKLEESVVVFLPASCEFLIAVIGVLKAGGTYFPVDDSTPTKRLEFLLNDSHSRLVLSNEAGMNRLHDWSGKALDLAQIIRPSKAAADKNPGVPSDSHRTAYLLYTSGSTGQPKGVQIEHHSLTNFVCHYHHHFNLTPQDRSSMLAYVAFDVSVSDIWPILCAGGMVVVPPKGILGDPDELIRWLETEEVTLSFVPTGLVEILFTRPWPRQMNLRYLVTGGDRLRVRPPAGLPFKVINGYGPTECTVFGTLSVVTPDDGRNTPPPIGRPLDNVKAYVLDEKLRLLPVGEAGELYLGGAQLARGYLNRPELTREQFIPDPFVGEPGARMYRTGDWACWLPNGELDFLGRNDYQIQIRGYRVELGEIEALLFAHDGVQQVCCVPQLIDGMPTGVVAHIVPKTISLDISKMLRVHLEAQLPEYMVPSQFVMHERLPLTPQGKVNRAAMMSMHSENAKPAKKNFVGDGFENALLRLWYSLLPAAGNSSKDATFASLGGDSLLAIKLMLGVEEIIGQRLEVSTFLVKPNFAGLCDAVRTRMAQTKFQSVLTIRKQGTRPPLFCIYGTSGDVAGYFDLAEVLGDDQPIFGIRSPALDDLSRLPQSIEEAAAEVVRCIRKVQPQGVPSLVGYSWAGLLAFEVARQLAKTEGILCYMALIGTTAPIQSTNFISRFTHFVRYFPLWILHLTMDRENRWRRLLHWQKMARRTKRTLAEGHVLVPEWVSTPIERHMVALMKKYHPLPKSDLAIDLFCERDSYQNQPHPLDAWQTSYLPDGGWNRWTRKPIHIHWLEGNHHTILKPPLVSGLAQSIRLAMDQYFNAGN
jgi:amino acid adenylation domain-containing protein